jgi:hypothetical protein
MGSFEPSGNFVDRVMLDVQRYESSVRNERIDALLSSKAAFSALLAGGALFGLLNLFRMASTFLMPAQCW